MASAQDDRHPEVPDSGQRDRSLMITEAQQADILAKLVQLEHELNNVHDNVRVDHAPSRALLDQLQSELNGYFAQARSLLRDAVTVEERISHLDFTPGTAPG